MCLESATTVKTLGIVTFDVPTRTAQEFYYNLDPTSQPVDLVTELEFGQINNARLDLFVAQYGGIDGITSLAGRNIVFLTNNESDEAWERTSFFDPLTAGPSEQRFARQLRQHTVCSKPM
jgi:hypothetical protein